MIRELHNFVTRPTLIRDAVEAWGPWIEKQINAPLTGAVIIETSLNLGQIAVEDVLGVQHNRAGSSRLSRRLKAFLVSAEIPPGLPPLLTHTKAPAQLRFSAIFEPEVTPRRSRLEWLDVPVALRLRTQYRLPAWPARRL